MRLFLGILPGEETASTLAASLGGLAELPGVAMVPAAKYHVTVSFFGDIREDFIEELRKPCGEYLIRVSSFSLSCEGLTMFSHRKHSSGVIVVPVTPPFASLAAVKDDLEGIARSAGIETERRPFAPHLTVARQRRRWDASTHEAFAALRVPRIEWTATGVSLIASVPGAHGHEYQSVWTAPLAKR